MVMETSQLLLNEPPSPKHPLSNSRAMQDGRFNLKNFFIDRCPKDGYTAENLASKKSSSHSQEKLEKPVGGWNPQIPIGHWRFKVTSIVFPILPSLEIYMQASKQNLSDNGFVLRFLIPAVTGDSVTSINDRKFS